MKPPPRPSRAAAVGSLIVLILALMALIGWAGLICILRIRFVPVLHDMGRELPGLTRVHLSMPVWAHAALGALLAAGLIAKELLVRNPRLRLTINIAAVVFLGLCAAVYALAMFLPMVAMLQSVQ